MVEKEKKYNYLQPCLGCRRYFNAMVYSADVISGTEAVAAQRCLASLLSNKLKREYSEMCGFVRARMSLDIMRSNTRLLQGARDKEVYICPRPDLADGAVVSLLELWRDYGAQSIRIQRLENWAADGQKGRW